jgi:hypothetical protein
MEAVGSSETLIKLKQLRRPKSKQASNLDENSILLGCDAVMFGEYSMTDLNLQQHHCENFKSHKQCSFVSPST